MFLILIMNLKIYPLKETNDDFKINYVKILTRFMKLKQHSTHEKEITTENISKFKVNFEKR